MNSNDKNSKLGQKGSCGGHETQFRNFGTPLIYSELLKLETSNLARRWTTVSSIEKNSKFCQRGSCGGHVTNIRILGPPNISRTVEARNFKFGTEMDISEL